MMAMAGPLPVEKPKLRGASHAVAFFLSFALTAWLVSRAHTTTGKLLFGTSALYHRIDWTAEARARMRKLDHSAIFVLIAGGYTPLLAIVPAADGSRVALVAMWAGALLGVVKSLLWAHAPKWVTAVVCVVLGWTGAFAVYTRVPVTGGASAPSSSAPGSSTAWARSSTPKRSPIRGPRCSATTRCSTRS
jgi:hemolysin III